MGKEQIVVGLEIGTSKVCAVVGEIKVDGTVKILGVGEAPSRGVRKGEIVDFETAGKCVREALVDAEEKSDVMIGSVYLGVTGSHISSFNNRGAVNIPEDREEITDDDFDEVQASAREVSIPAQNMFLHTILQHYYVDGHDGILNPIGMLGRRLEADFHVIHGVGTRIKNSVRCVKELDIEVLDVVFNPLAAAQVVLDQNQKNLGALVVDMGGGTTEYIVYVDGAVKASGCLAIGGDHITNDLSLGLRIPMARAEKLKIEEGSVLIGGSQKSEYIVLKDETGFAGKEIEREMLNTIVHCRVRETFELLKRELDQYGFLPYLGAGMLFTGGCSLIDGVNHLAEDVFGLPVHLTHAHAMSGLTSAFENPQLSTAIGLIKYAQAMMPERQMTGSLSTFFKKLKFF
ncbi:MAG TPA: cell division protein FtsA [Chthoniobacteraceae bacterium]|nr:cell division protein FtsA [Chthoniobacteraceae bacterium]